MLPRQIKTSHVKRQTPQHKILFLYRATDRKRETVMSDDIRSVLNAAAPAPAGHYSQATLSNGLLFISGQLPVRSKGCHSPGEPFTAQVEQALDNLFAILEAAGSRPQRILRVTAYIVGIDRWPEFDRVYGARMGAAKPARTVVPVAELHHGYLVEIDAVASCP